MQDKADFFYSFLFRFCFSNVSNYHHYYTGGIKKYYIILFLFLQFCYITSHVFPFFPQKFSKHEAFLLFIKKKKSYFYGE